MTPRARIDPPAVTQVEARRRLGEAYRILFDLAAKRRAAQTAEPGQPAPTTASYRDADRQAAI